jgi:hypothetical protein
LGIQSGDDPSHPWGAIDPHKILHTVSTVEKGQDLIYWGADIGENQRTISPTNVKVGRSSPYGDAGEKKTREFHN